MVNDQSYDEWHAGLVRANEERIRARIARQPLPILRAHLKEGTIFVVAGVYRGTAADGTEVDFGARGDETAIEAYLTANPSPTQW